MSRFSPRALAESSIIAAAGRAAVKGVVRASTGARASIRETNRRLAIGLRRAPAAPDPSSADLEALVKDSRTMRALIAIANVPIAAWHDARVKQWLDSFFALDLVMRFRLGGVALLTAVITHIVVIAAIGVHTFASGWATRAVAAAAALVLIAWPQAFAAAWKDRASR